MRPITHTIAIIAAAAGCAALLTYGAAMPGMQVIGSALAQDSPPPRESGADAIRRRQVEHENEEGESTGRYWTPFELARDGRCDEALNDLRIMANRGRGYENAQHIYGLCLLETGDREQGLIWISRAADAGLADAQATHVRLYEQDGTAYLSHQTAAMWLYLYENNPMRYRIGAEYALSPQVAEHARASIPRADYLAGINQARNWTPVFWSDTPPHGG